MRMVDLIHKKREGGTLSEAEIRFIIDGYSSGEIPDYQMSAWAMAVFYQGMDSTETAALTMEMVDSGEQIDLSAISGTKVDKHSTGGVGDTTTLVLAPLVASCGAPVAKMSGRGLGHTGGTIDKLEAFEGFQTEVPNERFIELVNRTKVAVIGQSGDLTPADKKLYSLRDVTATVESIPLIASSIMSKKIASGADAICLDVKVGAGAFMKNEEKARELARAMVDIGRQVGRKTVAVISDMNQPLGHAVGNALEIVEAVQTLQGKGPQDLTHLCLTLGSHMVVLAGKAADAKEARDLLEENMNNGQALQKLADLVQHQGGRADQVFDTGQLPQATYRVDIPAESEGSVQAIDAQEIGTLAMTLGAGRATKESVIDLAVGIVLHKKVGDNVSRGEALATLHMNDEQHKSLAPRLLNAYSIAAVRATGRPLIFEEIT